MVTHLYSSLGLKLVQVLKMLGLRLRVMPIKSDVGIVGNKDIDTKCSKCKLIDLTQFSSHSNM